jgi:uncharacterized FlgJ-related protein
MSKSSNPSKTYESTRTCKNPEHNHPTTTRYIKGDFCVQCINDYQKTPEAKAKRQLYLQKIYPIVSKLTRVGVWRMVLLEQLAWHQNRLALLNKQEQDGKTFDAQLQEEHQKAVKSLTTALAYKRTI